MTTTKQLEQNFRLSSKLAQYIASNPLAIKKIPVGASFVVFSSSNKELNKANQRLVRSLESEGKRVVKAEKRDSSTQPWVFLTV